MIGGIVKFLFRVMLCFALLTAPGCGDADTQKEKMLRALVEAQLQDQTSQEENREEEEAQKARMARLVDQSLAKLDRQSILDQALKIARNIDDPSNRAKALCYVAVAAVSDEIFDEAEDALNSDEERLARAFALMGIVTHLIWQEEYDHASNFVRLVGSAEERDNYFIDIAIGQAEKGDIGKAQDTALEIKSTYGRDVIKCNIARKLAESGDTVKAMETTQSIQIESMRLWAMGIISVATKNQQLLNDALTSAQSIKNNKSRVHALYLLATVYVENNDINQVKTIITSIKDPNSVKAITSRFALAYAEDGDFDQAYTTIKDFTTSLNNLNLLSGIVILHAQNGDKNEALSIARIIRDDFDKAGVLWTIAEKTNDPALLAEAKEVLSNMGDKVREKDVLSIIAPIEAKLLGIEKAKQTLKKLTQESDLVQALCEIAQQYPENK